MDTSVSRFSLCKPQSEFKKVQSHPWYKERLKNKYIKDEDIVGKKRSPKVFIGKNWTFMKDGLDDFRDGLPAPVSGDDVLIQGKKGVSPNVKGDVDISKIKQSVGRKRFTKDEICYSKKTPIRKQRDDYINEVEEGLLQHPLALYPHLEESLPAEVFEDVIDILDPEMNSELESSAISADEEDFSDETSQASDENPKTTDFGFDNTNLSLLRRQSDTRSDVSEASNPYKWNPKLEHFGRQVNEDGRAPVTPAEDHHIKKVTKDFCDWVASLGGDQNNIEESTIHSLFASGYETKPALSVPIHVVELTNVPPELRTGADKNKVGSRAGQRTRIESARDERPRPWVSGKTDYTPSWVEFKYGAWYLPVKLWQKRDAGEPLRDQKELDKMKTSEAKLKSLAMDEELAGMHGAQAFQDFVKKRDVRKPEFLDRVAMFQARAAKEEERKRREEERRLAKELTSVSTKTAAEKE